MDYKIETKLVGGLPAVSLSGKINNTAVFDIYKRINAALRAANYKIALDLKGLTYINSLAAGVILSLLKKARGNKGGIVLTNAANSVKKAFNITGAAEFFKVSASGKQSAEIFKNEKF